MRIFIAKFTIYQTHFYFVLAIVNVWNMHVNELIEDHFDRVTNKHAFLILDKLFEESAVWFDAGSPKLYIVVCFQERQSVVLH